MGLNRRSSKVPALALGAAMAAWIVAGGAQAQGQGQPPPVAGRPPPLSALPTLLGLSPDQREAFRAYTDAIAQDRLSHQNPMDMAQTLNLMATPERLDAMVDQMKSDEAAFQRRAAATKAFYAVLTPDQKQTFDAITRLPVAPPSSSPPPYRPPQPTLPQPQNPQALPPPGGPPPS
jgi:hypothetical protein